jgi:hypothetical protein
MELAKLYPRWLSIVQEVPCLRCTMAIEGVPVRFFRGDPADPPENYVSPTDGEDLQHQMLFEADGVPFRNTLYRLAIQNNSLGKVASIKLIEIDDAGVSINGFNIPFDVAPSNLIPLEAKPVNLKPITTLDPIETEGTDEKLGDDEGEDTKVKK